MVLLTSLALIFVVFFLGTRGAPVGRDGTMVASREEGVAVSRASQGEGSLDFVCVCIPWLYPSATPPPARGDPSPSATPPPARGDPSPSATPPPARGSPSATPPPTRGSPSATPPPARRDHSHSTTSPPARGGPSAASPPARGGPSATPPPARDPSPSVTPPARRGRSLSATPPPPLSSSTRPPSPHTDILEEVLQLVEAYLDEEDETPVRGPNDGESLA